MKGLGEAERDRFGEIVFRFFFGTLNHLRRAAGDPHPGNYLLLMEGLVLSVLGELRAGADWSALGAEHYDDGPPSTLLGEQDAAFWADDGPARRAAA